MPRSRRDHYPGNIVHVISRILGGEFLLDGDAQRGEYLNRATACFARADWTPLAYAVMSNHVHWAFLAGSAPLRALFQPLNGGFATWLNRRRSPGGVLWADRPKTIWFATADALKLITYIHNNPVRAGVARTAGDSSWTSHRAYLGEATPRALTDPNVALRLCGFRSSEKGHFDAWVAARRADPRSEILSGDLLAGYRRKVRHVLGGAAEVGSLRVGPDPDVALYAPEFAAIRPRWDVDHASLLNQVARVCRIEVERIRSRDRARPAVYARRVLIATGYLVLGRSLTDVAASVGLAVSSASSLLRRDTRQLTRLREDVVRVVQGLQAENRSPPAISA